MSVTLVYAKCNQNKRLALWYSLGDMARVIQEPWILGGDFNVIRSNEDKLGGLPVIVNETEDFNHCINISNLEKNYFKGTNIPGGMEGLMRSAYLKDWIGCYTMIGCKIYFLLWRLKILLEVVLTILQCCYSLVGQVSRSLSLSGS